MEKEKISFEIHYRSKGGYDTNYDEYISKTLKGAISYVNKFLKKSKTTIEDYEELTIWKCNEQEVLTYWEYDKKNKAWKQPNIY